MAMYTYDDFLNAKNQTGLNFSDADLKLAEKNPDAGMKLLTYKKNYYDATTDEGRALANAGAENVRSTYGNYTGGIDGSGYYSLPSSLSGYTPTSFPSFDANGYMNELKTLNQAQSDYAPFEYEAAPVYESRYDSRIDDAIDRISNIGSFNYNPENDEVFKAYQRMYEREGKRATEDTLGNYAAMTGGRPSSYAVTAAAQQGNYYASKASDKLPEMYNDAYSKYLNAINLERAQLSDLINAEQNDYNKYINSLNQHNAERNQAYNEYLNNYNRIGDQINGVNSLASLAWQQYLNDIEKENTDYERYKNLVDSNFSNAKLKAQYGDYSGLEALGIDTSGYNNTDISEAIEVAKLKAQYGDLSGLQALGIDTSNYNPNYADQLALAKTAAQYGDYSLLKQLGITPAETSEGKPSEGVRTHLLPPKKSRDEEIGEAAYIFYSGNPNVALDSRTLDNWLSQNGYSGEDAALFKAFLESYGATYTRR